MKKISVSAICLTKNSQGYISDCLKSLQFCDEIIVIDDYSSDQTVKKAQKYTTNIIRRRLENNFAAQRNFGLTIAKNDWVLFIDSDEIVSQQLAKEIRKKVQRSKLKAQSSFVGYYVKRRDYFLGKWLEYGETSKVQLLRLAKKDAGKWTRAVHEVWEVKGNIGKLRHPILHYSYQTITEFLKSIDRYSTINAAVFNTEKKEASAFEIVVYPVGKFVQNFFFRLGFLDGTTGFIIATFMSFHSFLTRAKLYLLQRNESV